MRVSEANTLRTISIFAPTFSLRFANSFIREILEANIANQNGVKMRILESVEEVNDIQKTVLFDKFLKYFKGDVKGKRAAVWGLSFKPGTDDMREAPSLVLIKQLQEAGCEVSVYDPVAMQECRRRIGDSVRYAENIYDCSKDADVIFHVTEWKEFRIPDWDKIKTSASENLILIDGRNVFSSSNLGSIEYLRIG